MGGKPKDQETSDQPDQGQQPPAETEYKAGRPFLFTKPDELRAKIQAYFDECDPHLVTRMMESGYNNDGKTIFLQRETMTDQQPYTIVGLARALGVTRHTIRNYKKFEHYSDDIPPEVRQELITTIEDAYLRVEEYNEKALHRNGIANGIKFNLTNNFDWVDKQVVETRSPEEDLDALDDPAEQRDDVADAAAAELAKDTPAPAEQPKPEESDAEPRPETQE